MTKQYFVKAILAFLISLLLLLTACAYATSPTQNLALQTGTEAPTQTLRPTSIRTELPTLQALPSLTPTQAAIKFIPTTFEQPGTWNLRHPYADPNAPRLISKSQDGYQLDPGFEVASIELSYRWIGIGDSVAKYQRIERRDGGFWNNGTQISAASVSKLVEAVAHLRPEPQVLSVTVWTDDYPFWAIELTSVSGDKILLYSQSNSSSYIPWNVIFNGEIYSQYDGAIPSALDGLFKVFDDHTIAFTCGCTQEGFLPSVTYEPPPAQLSEGFSGLLPIYRYFNYFPDPQKGELSGYLSDFSWTSQVEGAEINWLTGLQAIDLDMGPDQTVSCSLESMPTDDPQWIYWRFNCPMVKPTGSTTYRYPIRLTYATTSGRPYILSGELFGYWEASMTLPVVPYPEEIGDILESSPVAGGLLSDHLVYVPGYYSAANETTGIITHEWDAEVILLGQVQFGKRIIPYTVSLDAVNIQDGKLVRWDLDRAELEGLLREVLNQPVTQRFLEFDPQGVINLYYAESDESPIIRADDLPACSYLPQGSELPLPGKPLRGYAFNQPQPVSHGGFYNMQLVFLDNRLRIFQMDLDPASRGDAYWMSVLPVELKPQNAPPFIRISTFLGSPDITVLWDEHASPDDVSYYESMFTGWDVFRMTTFDQGLRLNQRWFDLTPEGELILLNCQAP
ncbi:MAG TPA: hypothetical protein VLD65_12710 [Anaerolineales bacterium]|nr:hypothetical protein [Anaerolineales bacterium]